jgi:DNA-binding NtrC family response regulator
VISKRISETRGGSQISDRLTTLENEIRLLLEELGSLQKLVGAFEVIEPLGDDKNPALQVPFDEAVRRFEASLIRRALEQARGNQTRASRILGVRVTTLSSMVKRLGINPLDYALGTPRKRPES